MRHCDSPATSYLFILSRNTKFGTDQSAANVDAGWDAHDWNNAYKDFTGEQSVNWAIWFPALSEAHQSLGGKTFILN